MNWKRFAQLPWRSHRQPASVRVRFRPSLDILEDRTVLSTTGSGIPITFNVDPTQSSLALSGNIGGVDVQAQGPGSLTTTYEGSFAVVADEVNGGIQFNNGSNDVFADNSGNWQPKADGTSGAEPANYGATVSFLGTALAAVRGLHVGADTGGTPLTLYQNDDGTFGFTSGQTLVINAGSGAYSHPLAGHGVFNLAGNSAQNQAGDGSFIDNGDGTYAITAPVSLTISGTISGIMYSLTISGSIGATGGSAAPGGHHGGGIVDQALASGLASPLSSTASQPVAAQTLQDSSGLVVLQNAAQAVNTPTGISQVVDSTVLHTAHQGTPAALDQLSALDSVFQNLSA